MTEDKMTFKMTLKKTKGKMTADKMTIDKMTINETLCCLYMEYFICIGTYVIKLYLANGAFQ